MRVFKIEKNMILDRELQLELLSKIAECYPFAWTDFEKKPDSEDYLKIAINLNYLKGHGLLSEDATNVRPSTSGNGGGVISISKPKITEKGLDFLKDDGGLSAILNVVTIRFETETLKAIISTKINESDLSQEQKQSMTLALEELPAESIKHLTTKLLDECVDNLPGAMTVIGTWLSSF